LTTGGIHLPSQSGFDMVNPDGDATYREIPGDVAIEQITITHKYYDHTDADADLNVIFPLAHFRDLVKKQVIGALASRHYGFMGHIDGAQLPILNERTAPEVAAKLRADGVDFAFLTPA
jgi:D-proline reductase (dithiol) PrdB